MVINTFTLHNVEDIDKQFFYQKNKGDNSLIGFCFLVLYCTFRGLFSPLI